MSDAVHFTAQLPTKRMSADCLIRDQFDRILVLQPTYKETWDIPGGAVEVDESPWNAARREVREEIGLIVNPGSLVSVDYLARAGEFTEAVAFLFDAGSLDPALVDRLVLEPCWIAGAGGRGIA